MRKVSVFFVSMVTSLFCVSTSQSYVEKKFPYSYTDVLKASKFVQKQGYLEGYDENNKLVGYVIFSKDWAKNFIGYSGKHINTLIGIDTRGTITGVKVISHWEPIFLIGIKDSDYNRFLQQYVGKNVNEPVILGKDISLDAITGATVTAVVQHAIILKTARSVADLVGITQRAEAKTEKKVGKVSEKYEPLSWDQLIAAGAIKTLRVTMKDLGKKDEEDVFLELYAGIITPPSIGKNLLGDKLYMDVLKRIKEGESALFVGTTKGSFKGFGFAHGGIFGTITVEQDGKVFVFSVNDFENVSNVNAEGAPLLKEAGVFIIKGKQGEVFDQTRPFKLHITLPYQEGNKKLYKTFTMEYQLPLKFVRR